MTVIGDLSSAINPDRASVIEVEHLSTIDEILSTGHSLPLRILGYGSRWLGPGAFSYSSTGQRTYSFLNNQNLALSLDSSLDITISGTVDVPSAWGGGGTVRYITYFAVGSSTGPTETIGWKYDCQQWGVGDNMSAASSNRSAVNSTITIPAGNATVARSVATTFLQTLTSEKEFLTIQLNKSTTGTYTTQMYFLGLEIRFSNPGSL
jgi:hypothetical protein